MDIMLSGSDIIASEGSHTWFFENKFPELVAQCKKELFDSAKENGVTVSWFSWKLDNMAVEEACATERLESFVKDNLKEATYTKI